MIDWINIALRTLMCLAFLVLVLRPMMMAMVRREPDQEALEELAKSAVGSAFKAWSQNADAPAYYHNPELALLVVSKPELLNVPPPSEAAEKALADVADAPDAAAQGEAATTELAAAVTADGSPVTPGASALAMPNGEASGEAGSTESVEEEVDPDEQLQQMRDRIKQEQKKAKPTIPAELLNNANSYEDKLMVVRMIVDQERDRVAATLKRMVKVE